jgi:BolA protein
MTSEERMAIITERLTQAFLPERLEVIDDSHQHRGHAGSRDGAGHYTVMIDASALKLKSRVDVHRAIYQVLNDLIPKEIHALQIKAF